MRTNSSLLHRRREQALLILHTELDPITFCEYWLGIHTLPLDERLDIKRTHGFRAQCKRALSAALNLSPETTNQWGADFKRMPHTYRKRLAQALFWKQAHDALLFERTAKLSLTITLPERMVRR